MIPRSMDWDDEILDRFAVHVAFEAEKVGATAG
jgi:hypothetical protein